MMGSICCTNPPLRRVLCPRPSTKGIVFPLCKPPTSKRDIVMQWDVVERTMHPRLFHHFRYGRVERLNLGWMDSKVLDGSQGLSFTQYYTLVGLRGSQCHLFCHKSRDSGLSFRDLQFVLLLFVLCWHCMLLVVIGRKGADRVHLRGGSSPSRDAISLSSLQM